MTPDLRLLVNGTGYGGWKSIRVRRSIEEIAGGYTLGVSELWPTQAVPREIRTGDKAAVTIDGTTVITGYVDAVAPGFDARSHGISITGRDATADLVDCSAMHGKGEWRNATLAQIARDLATPFGITVKVDADIGAPFPVWTLQEGETAFDCLERATRQRAVLLLSDGRGGLILGKAGTTRVATALTEGENLLACSARNDATGRYKTYILKGQRAGSDDISGDAASGMKATASDAGITRARTLVIVSEDEADPAALQRRAKWEASVRAARALTVNATVQGWTHASGLWTPNTLVRVNTPALRLGRDMLIRDVDLVVDEQGTRAELVLAPPEAYSLLAMPGKKKAPKRKGAKGGADAEDVHS